MFLLPTLLLDDTVLCEEDSDSDSDSSTEILNFFLRFRGLPLSLGALTI